MTWIRTHSQLTTATPAALWRRWTTTEHWPTDDPGVAWARVDGPLAVGTTGAVKTHGAPARGIRLTRVEHERALDFTIRLPLATLTITHLLEPQVPGTAGGTVRATHGVVLDGPLHRLYAVLVGGRLARGLPVVVRNVTAGAIDD